MIQIRSVSNHIIWNDHCQQNRAFFQPLVNICLINLAVWKTTLRNLKNPAVNSFFFLNQFISISAFLVFWITPIIRSGNCPYTNFVYVRICKAIYFYLSVWYISLNCFDNKMLFSNKISRFIKIKKFPSASEVRTGWKFCWQHKLIIRKIVVVCECKYRFTIQIFSCSTLSFLIFQIFNLNTIYFWLTRFRLREINSKS